MAALALTALTVTGCSSDDDEATTSGGGGDTPEEGSGGGELAVCSDIPYEPFEFEGDGPSGYTGFDIELLAAVAETDDRELSVTDVEFDGITGNLESGECEVVASAFTITEEREAEVDFTDPYFDATQSLLVKSDSGYAGLDDLADKVIGVQTETTGQTYANDNTPEGATVTDFGGADELFAALESGEVDAVLQDFPVNAYRTTQDDSLEVVDEFETDEQYGFAVKTGETELLDALNEGLASVRDDGTYDQLYEEYFGSAPGE